MSRNNYSGKSFYDYDPDELNFVPFDIETTGFWSCDGHFITTFILHNNGKYHIWFNTNGDTDVNISEIYDEIEEKSGIPNTVVYICETERELLENVGEYLDTNFGDNSILVAFNGEIYKGTEDFDVPFIRTRCIQNAIDFILSGYWYTDAYDTFSTNGRIDTTVQASPSPSKMKKSDLIKFINDSYTISVNYDSMKKAEVVRAVKTHPNVSTARLEEWVEQNEVVGVEPSDPSSFNSSELKRFIDSESLDISYDKMSKNEIAETLESDPSFSNDLLVEWHEETGRDIGKEELTKLDGAHKVLVEKNFDTDGWVEQMPIKIEEFEPFDPYESSAKAVTDYKDGNYSGIIIHCLADVAKTLNFARMLPVYTPQKEYNPKIL